MRLKLPSVSHIAGKRVLVRVDFNVPLAGKRGEFKVVDESRVQAALSTIEFLRHHGAQVVLMSHLGRPEGKRELKYSLQPLVPILNKLLKTRVEFVPYTIGPMPQQVVRNLQPGQVALLENLRFYPGEKENDEIFARELSKLGEVYINDAFSMCHRAHASVQGVTRLLPSFAGFQLAKEVQTLSSIRDNPKRPLVAVIGGAKISDKVEAIVNLAHTADLILIGGGVANTFLKAEGLEIHKSYLQDAPADLKKKGINYVNVAQGLLDQMRTERVWYHGHVPIPKILYPLDVVAARSPTSRHTQIIDLTTGAQDTPRDKSLMYLDIGPKTVELYRELLSHAQTIFWNGPMGVWEELPFAKGTRLIGRTIANSKAFTVVGGGDTVAAVESLHLTKHFSYLSMAGGATLDFLAGKKLPGLTPLTKG